MSKEDFWAGRKRLGERKNLTCEQVEAAFASIDPETEDAAELTRLVEAELHRVDCERCMEKYPVTRIEAKRGRFGKQGETPKAALKNLGKLQKAWGEIEGDLEE